MDTPQRLDFCIHARNIELIEGTTGSGKTNALLQRAKALIDEGFNSASILVVGQTRIACSILKKRFSEILPPDTELPIIATCEDLESFVLNSEIGYRTAKRHFRIVGGVDERILDKDLETTGIPLRTIERAKQRIQHGWASGNPEIDAHDDELLKVKNELALCLEDIDSMMKDEAHYLAARTMLDERGSCLSGDIQHVLVDDLHLLCRSSQIFITSWAHGLLMLASDDHVQNDSHSELGYENGMHEIADTFHVAIQKYASSHRSRKALDAIDRAYARCTPGHTQNISPCADSAKGSLRLLSYESPRDEVLGIARLASGLKEQQDPNVSIAITATNEIWLENLQRALSNIGVAYVDLSAFQAASKDDSISEESLLEGIAANPTDGLLWRRWCASNDPLANSPFFAALRHEKERRPLFESLLHLPEDSSERNLTALEKKHLSAVRELAAQAKEKLSAGGNTSHQDSSDALATSTQLLPNKNELSEPIAVGPIESLIGLNPDVVILFGAANGSLLPKDYFDLSKMEEPKRQTCRDNAFKLLYESLGKSMDMVVISNSRHATLSEAQALGLKVDKIEYLNGKRLACISLDESIAAIADENAAERIAL